MVTNHYSIIEIEKELNGLVKDGICYSYERHYSIHPNVEELVKKRLKKEEIGKKFLKKSGPYINLIRRFPFVRSICISGSLSKGVIHEDGDIDYFIITAPNRLWIARTFLVLFKKIFLFNSKKYFCVNYFVDTNNLEIPDHNIFTATEITHLIPVSGGEVYQEFKDANRWIDDHYPLFEHPIAYDLKKSKSKIQSFFEWFLNGYFGNKLDRFFMLTTLKRWIRKFRDFDVKKFTLALRTQRGVSKHHPQDFQNHVLTQLEARKKALNII
jgi:hypothetical protein